MRWKLIRMACVIAILAATLTANLWIERAQLPYDSQGRFFDADQAVVFHEQSVIALGAVTVLLYAIGILGLWLIRKR